MIRIGQVFVNPQGNDLYGRVDGGYLPISSLLRQFHVGSGDDGAKLPNAANVEVRTAYMDTNTEPRTVNGLLLQSVATGSFFVLLLDHVSRNADELPTFVRIGIANCESYKGEKTDGLFKDCEMQTITIF